MKRVVTIKKAIVAMAMICKTGLMMCACTPHASTQGLTAWTLADDILSVNGANRVIFQSDVAAGSYMITMPGTYAIGESLTRMGAAPVITVTVPGVTIDLKGYTIAGSGGATSGILFDTGSSGRVTNGTISGFSSGGVNFNNALYGTVDSLLIREGVGIAVTNTNGVEISGVNGNPPNPLVLVSITGSNSVVVHDCFVNQGFLLEATNSSNIVIHDCIVSIGALFSFDMVTNSIVEDCYMEGIGTAPAAILNDSSNNVLRNVRMAGAVQTYIAITGAASSNNLIENCALVHQNENIALPSLSIGVGVSRTRIISTVIKDTSVGAPDIEDNGTDTEVLNCLLNSVSGPGITFAIIHNADVVANDANWWQNLDTYRRVR